MRSQFDEKTDFSSISYLFSFLAVCSRMSLSLCVGSLAELVINSKGNRYGKSSTVDYSDIGICYCGAWFDLQSTYDKQLAWTPGQQV